MAKRVTKVDNPARAKQKRFLEAYALLGTVTHAAEAVPVSREMHYRWLHSPKCAAEFQVANDRFVDRVRDAVRCRAIDGWLEPVVYQGRLQSVKGKPVVVRKFSDRLLELLAKGKVPELKEKLVLDASQTLAEIVARSYDPK